MSKIDFADKTSQQKLEDLVQHVHLLCVNDPVVLCGAVQPPSERFNNRHVLEAIDRIIKIALATQRRRNAHYALQNAQYIID